MQGVGQASGLVSQPLFYYFKEGLGLDPARTTEYLAVLTIPWVIKPVYGLISDFMPLFGYALMVENGQETGQTKQFQATQWMWINVAAILTAWFGGYLSQTLPPTSALHVAALITVAAPVAVMLGALFLVHETKVSLDLRQMKATAGGLRSALMSRTLWAVMVFLAFWSFSPSFGMPLYYHMIDRLQFSQGFIGWLGVCRAIGSVLGAWLYRKRLAALMSTRNLVSLSIILGTAGTLANLWLVAPNLMDVRFPIGDELLVLGTVSEVTAVTLSLVIGVAEIIGVLTMLSLAADACPKQAEGFTFAALMSVFNLSAQVSAIIGARLYVDVFSHSLTALILVSAAFTLACFLLFPWLSSVFKTSDERGKLARD